VSSLNLRNSPNHISLPASANDIILDVLAAVEDMHMFVKMESLRTWLFCNGDNLSTLY
jgi:hypothetical protein